MGARVGTWNILNEIRNKRLMTVPEKIESIKGELDDWKVIKQGYDWKWRTK